MMNVDIKSINNKGDFDKEYVTLKVNNDCDIGDYILADNTFIDKNKVSNKLRHTFWIPDKNAEAGDFVKIYTKLGKDRSVDNKADTKTHIFYWGLKTAVWNNEGDCAVLFEIGVWQQKGVK